MTQTQPLYEMTAEKKKFVDVHVFPQIQTFWTIKKVTILFWHNLVLVGYGAWELVSFPGTTFLCAPCGLGKNIGSGHVTGKTET